MFVKRLIPSQLKKQPRSSILWFGVLVCAYLFVLNQESFSQTWSWKGAYVLKQGSSGYQGPVEIVVKDGLVQKILPSESSQAPVFILPGFCDAYVTLGSNSLGGQRDKKETEEALNSLLQHGFTFVQSVADGSWLEEFAKNQSKNGNFPQIKVTPPILISDSEELRNQSGKLSGYQVLKSEEEAMDAISSKSKKNLHLFLRYTQGDSFQIDGKLLYRMKAKSENLGIELSVSTFGEEFANWEALSSGVKILYHPIPETEFLAPVTRHLFQAHWGPMLGVYYNQKLVGTPEFKQEWSRLLSWSPSFKEKALPEDWISSLTGLSEKERSEAEKEYNSYLAFLKARKNLSPRILLASGAGYYLTFPGIGGWKELSILSEIFGPEEALRTASETTCSFLGAPHEGRIRTGGKAHLLIFQEDPLKGLEKLSSLRTIITEKKRTELKRSKQQGKPK
ncbi:hypothetical protein CH373_03525 [Leptospira perolatii]|uniref:Amidohydrolase-related domain-containing protein n=1 Tax=Leptospira perolatii TaxID=2023191 RepID=A0A2M9ZT45_9LEPT|nr:hypothetical protein CH360_14405 [Leptospira perolatii]PJZ75236.1 hypothetical protein CH373_03525 [Leptospira perolatii]